MIGTNFAYCRPQTLKEAAALYSQFKNPIYYAGGSEIITLCTAGSISPQAVIDLKAIPQLNIMEEAGGYMIFGACKTLEDIRLSKLYPLLGQTAGRIADHTNQCRITLGGNLCGTIRYREMVLPLLLGDARVELFGPLGKRWVSVHDVFRGRMQLLPGEMVVSVQVKKEMTQAPYAHIKKTFNEKIGYPAVTAEAIKTQGKISMAFSGICSNPFWTLDGDKPTLPEDPLDDCEGSGPYRLHLFNILVEEIAHLLSKEGSHDL